jgi:soluble epoxide hydrolase/lipid-phosphate phosphatase
VIAFGETVEMAPAAVQHQLVELRTGVSMHYVEARAARADAPTVLLVHGFPDSWFGWRHQIGALQAAGYRVLAPDMRGYGETRPVRREAAFYRMELLVGDLIAMLDQLLIEQVVLVAHDWGATCAWNLATHFPSRVLALASLCVPFFPWKDENPWLKMQANAGRFDYQLYFQTDAAEAELGANPLRTVTCFIRGMGDRDVAACGAFFQSPWQPTKDGGAMVKYPPNIARSEILSASEADYYAWQFSRSSYFGPLSWYRNVEANWRWNARTQGARITSFPCLVITAELDATLPPSMAAGMKGWIDDLTVVNVEGAGHWVATEKPHEVNAHLLGWLADKLSLGSHAKPRL